MLNKFTLVSDEANLHQINLLQIYLIQDKHSNTKSDKFGNFCRVRSTHQTSVC